MPMPTFEGFDLNDGVFITERVVFKGYAKRAATRAVVNRREGIKLLGTQFGEKIIEISGVIVAESAMDLQSKLDDMKAALTQEEGALVVEQGRTFLATAEVVTVPDEHYSLTMARWEVTFMCSNPFSEGALQTVVQNVPSGVFTFSGRVNISGTMYARPTLIYTPPSAVGQTFIKKLSIYHTPTGQTTTISGFGAGTSLGYQNAVTVNLDDFTSLEGSSAIDNSGSFPIWQPGTNDYTIAVSGRAFPGGSVSLAYKPRYL